MRWVPELKSLNLNDFMTLGVVRERFGYGGSGSGKYLGHFFDVLMDLEARTLPKM